MKKIESFMKWLKLRNVLKRFVFFLCSTLLLEIIFALSIFDSYEKEGIINIFLYSLILSSCFSIASGVFKDKVNRIIKME